MNEFTWLVHESGHHIVRWNAESQFTLSGVAGTGKTQLAVRAAKAGAEASARFGGEWVKPLGVSAGSEKPVRTYSLRNPALFRTFAGVRNEHDSIVAFADRYGLLTDAEEGESIDTWTSAITEVQSAVRCWEAQSSVSGSKEAGTRFQPRQDTDVAMTIDAEFSARTDRDVCDLLASKISQNISRVRPVFIAYTSKD